MECLQGHSTVLYTYQYQSARPQVLGLENFVNYFRQRVACKCIVGQVSALLLRARLVLIEPWPHASCVLAV